MTCATHTTGRSICQNVTRAARAGNPWTGSVVMVISNGHSTGLGVDWGNGARAVARGTRYAHSRALRAMAGLSPWANVGAVGESWAHAFAAD